LPIDWELLMADPSFQNPGKNRGLFTANRV